MHQWSVLVLWEYYKITHFFLICRLFISVHPKKMGYFSSIMCPFYTKCFATPFMFNHVCTWTTLILLLTGNLRESQWRVRAVLLSTWSIAIAVTDILDTLHRLRLRKTHNVSYTRYVSVFIWKEEWKNLFCWPLQKKLLSVTGSVMQPVKCPVLQTL